MVLIGHGTFGKNNSKKLKKKKKQDNLQRQMFQISKWVYQNVSNEVLSTWFKFQAKILTLLGVLRKSD